MRFIRRTLGYSLFDHKRNEELMNIMDKQLKITPIIDFATTVPEKLERTRTQTDSRQDTKMILKYQPKGKRCLGRPLKRWKDSVMKRP
jgi:hypothetical protein